MTFIYIKQRQIIDQSKLEKARDFFLDRDNEGWADSITGYRYKPIMTFRKMESRLDPTRPTQMMRFLLAEIYPRYGEGVYIAGGVVNGRKGWQHFGTYRIYRENGSVKVLDWKAYKELYGDN